MNKLKVGIMPRRQFQRRMAAVAAGKIKPKRGETRVWYSSMKSIYFI